MVIVGGGAAGLMAAATAAELGVRAVLLERKHLPGRKLLMCGNARCNITSNLSAAAMIEAYGPPVSGFLRKAIGDFPPEALRAWMRGYGLNTVAHKDGRVFPASEKAADVLHFFTDLLRDAAMPVMFNCPVEGIRPVKDGWEVAARFCTFHCRAVLLATGGVSYPKTGSVGDGQKMAGVLGHKLIPYRPGLVGFAVRESWLTRHPDEGFQAAQLTILDRHGQTAGVTQGELRCDRWGITGPCVVNASRIIARNNLEHYTFCVDLFPSLSPVELAEKLRGEGRGGSGKDLERRLADLGIPGTMVRDFVQQAVMPVCAGVCAGKPLDEAIVSLLKGWVLHPVKPNSLKEAMVTVGGVDLTGVDESRMESKSHAGLFFAGEVMDMDGPTGGFNLHAAFATARLAMRSIAGEGLAPNDGFRRKPENERSKRKNGRFKDNPRAGGKRRPR
ncbi:MAG: aminoacetone oxidase family FAD-binding enzyme [Kiritimatiellae bacterium]|nr:aminoacetone oxidase family FAD-binding enzyme [Kiritimatiellia bacterium]